MERKAIATFYIDGKETKWRMGWGLGEPVYYSLYDQGNFIKDQRVCWELMQGFMDEVHRLPKQQNELYQPKHKTGDFQ